MDLHLRHEVDRVLAIDGETGANLANDLLVDYLMELGFVGSEALESALRGRPRHLFLPGCDLRSVYQDRAVTTALNRDGWFDSSCSTPSIVSMMTEALAPESGSRILEIGSGTGWTAAVMAEMAPEVQVTTLEVLPELAKQTSLRLQHLEPDRIELRCADGSNGSAGPGPFDRIIFACGASEIPREISDLLVEGGRLVIPIGHFIHVLEKRDGRLEGRPLAVATFIAFRDGAALRKWRVTDRRAVLVPERHAALAEELGREQAETVAGPELDAGQLATLLFWLSLREPDNEILFADQDGGWGLGILDEETRSAAALFCPGEFTFRHYRDGREETQIAIWGGGKAGDRLFEICEEVADLGWPRLEELTEVLGGAAPVASEALVETQLGEDLWTISRAAALSL